MSSNASRTRLGRKLVAAAVSRASDMLQTPSSSRRGRSLSRSGGPNKRRIVSKSRSRSMSAMSGVSFGGSALSEATSVRAAKGRRTGGKKLKINKKKNVKISRDFKLKVQKATEIGKVSGQFHSTDIGIITAGLTGQQAVGYPLQPSSVGNNSLFPAKRVLHVASRLWNGKSAVANPQIGDAMMMQPLQTVVDVKKQWWVYNIRNNSPRTVYIRLWKCMPKQLQNSTDAIGSFRQSISRAITEGYLFTTPVGYNDALLYQRPQLYAQFNQFYKVEEDTMVIEPGQSYEFTVQGPSMEYDMKKFYVDGIYQEYQKQDVQLLTAIWTDLIGEVGGTVVARQALDPNDGEVIFESQYFCNVVMPETVGWQSGGIAPAAGPVLNVNRVKRYVWDQFERVTSLPGADDRTDVIKNTV